MTHATRTARRTRTLLGPLAGAACVALLVSGCGGGDDSSSDRATTSPSASAGVTTSDSATASDSASTSTSDSPSTSDSASASSSVPVSTATGAAFAALPGDQIAATSKAAMLGLTEAHYQGSVAGSNSGKVSLDVKATASGDCTGTVGIKGGTATVLATGGQSWFKGDSAFWKAAAGAAAPQIIQAVGDKWVLDTNGDFSQFCDLDQFFANLFDSSGGATYQTQGNKTVGGQDAVAVQRSSSDSGSSVGYVLTGQDHYLVRIERSSGGQRGELNFSDFDQQVDVQAPAPTDVVDPSTLGQ